MLPRVAIVNNPVQKRDGLGEGGGKTSEVARAGAGTPRDTERGEGAFLVACEREDGARTFFRVCLARTPRGDGKSSFVEERDEIIGVAAR